MVELQNFKKMKDLLAENLKNFWKNVVLRKNLGTFVFGKHIVVALPPHPGGALEWKGAQILEYTPPNQKPVGTALVRFPPWPGIFFKLARCGHTLRDRVTSCRPNNRCS